MRFRCQKYLSDGAAPIALSLAVGTALRRLGANHEAAVSTDADIVMGERLMVL
jgi:hypothetical protein